MQNIDVLFWDEWSTREGGGSQFLCGMFIGHCWALHMLIVICDIF